MKYLLPFLFLLISSSAAATHTSVSLIPEILDFQVQICGSRTHFLAESNPNVFWSPFHNNQGCTTAQSPEFCIVDGPGILSFGFRWVASPGDTRAMIFLQNSDLDFITQHGQWFGGIYCGTVSGAYLQSSIELVPFPPTTVPLVGTSLDVAAFRGVYDTHNVAPNPFKDIGDEERALVHLMRVARGQFMRMFQITGENDWLLLSAFCNGYAEAADVGNINAYLAIGNRTAARNWLLGALAVVDEDGIFGEFGVPVIQGSWGRIKTLFHGRAR